MSTTALTKDSKAILLLCGVFGGKSDRDGSKPLTNTEYNKVAALLVSHQLSPKDLLDTGTLEDLQLDLDRSVGYSRIVDLLARGATLAFALETWMNKGIWILTRSDSAYPEALRTRLGNASPPILYGVGDLALINQEGLAVVGSRNVDEAGEQYTAEIGQFCASRDVSIISGGARGVDQVAMLAALNSRGTAVGVVADSLLKTAVAGKFRDAIMDKRLLLLSPYNPDARFTVGNAMGRNRYIYALSQFALIISAEKNSGGTWAGASEELKRPNGISVFVRSEGKMPNGNDALIALGAYPFPARPWDDSLFSTLKNMNNDRGNKFEQTSLFD